MKRWLALTLFAVLTISCSRANSAVSHSSKGASMTNSVGTQAELDAANQRVNQFKQELKRQGFHEVSVSRFDETSDSSPAIINEKETVVLEGQYGTLKDLRLTLWTSKWLQKDQPHLGGGIEASLSGEPAERDFEELYKRVSSVITGHAQ